MTRKFNSDLRAEIGTLFPDNAIGAITPAVLRQFATDLIDSLRPTSTYYSRTGVPLPVALTTTPQKLIIFDEVANGETTELEGTIVGNAVTVNNSNGLLEMEADLEVEGAGSRELTLHLYKNGLATGQTVTANLEGANSPVVIPAQAKDIPLAVNDFFEIWASVDSNDTVTFNTGSNWFSRLITSRNPV